MYRLRESTSIETWKGKRPEMVLGGRPSFPPTVHLHYRNNLLKNMKKIIFKLIHFLGISKNWSYSRLEKWGVADIFKGKIIWDA